MKGMSLDKAKLLVVDDELDLLAELKPLLERSGFDVVTCGDGTTALHLVEQEQPDLIVLDVLLPHMNGREVLRQLRQQNDWRPVILLTQVNTSMERVQSLQEGADDYIDKPFDPFELIARIQAVMRRTKIGEQSLNSYHTLQCGDLFINRLNRQAQFKDQPIALTTRAFGVLEFLLLHPNTIITREQLLEQVWGWRNIVESRAVDIRIAELRKVLNDDPSSPHMIETVIGQGYRLLGQVSGHR